MYDNLLGDDERENLPHPAYVGRPKGRPAGSKNKSKSLMMSGGVDDALGDIMSGVSARWLQMVFGVERNTVSRALQGIKPIRMAGHTAYYAVKDVAPYLVAPKMRIEEYLETISPDKLPEHLRETYWNVQAKSQKVRVAAGDLWRTEDVIEVLGEIFKHIKNTILLWTDTVEEQVGLSDDQRHIILRLSDDLQQEIYRTVVQRASESKTRSQLKELDGEIEDEDYEDI